MRRKSYNLELLDAAENVYFARETEFVSQELIKQEYVQGMTRKLLPIENEMPPENDTYIWRLSDMTGKAERHADAGDDIPQAGVFKTENVQRIDEYVLGYSYTLDEIRKAARFSMPLERDRAVAVRDGIERKFNDIACDGDSNAGLTGFLGLTGTNTYTPATKAAGGTAWLDANGALVATPAEVIADVTAMIRKPFVDSKEIEKVSRIVLPTAQMAALSQVPRSEHSDVSILNWLKLNCPGVEFLSWERLAYVDATSTPNLTTNKDRAIAYNPDKTRLKFLLPLEFEQMPPVNPTGFRFKVNCRAKFGGVICYRPKSVLFADGI